MAQRGLALTGVKTMFTIITTGRPPHPPSIRTDPNIISNQKNHSSKSLVNFLTTPKQTISLKHKDEQQAREP